MGIGIGAILSLAVSAAGVVASSIQAKKARKSQRRAQAIQSASEEIKNRAARRRAAREERIRRAQIISSAGQSGAGTSSGVTGAVGGLRSSTAAGTALQSSNVIANQGISAALASAQRAQDRGKSILAFSNLAQEGINIFDDEGFFD